MNRAGNLACYAEFEVPSVFLPFIFPHPRKSHDISGDANEQALVYADGVLVWSLDTSQLASYRGAYCGQAAAQDAAVPVKVDLPSHVASSLTLRFTTTLDSGAADEWFGITNVVVTSFERFWPALDTFESVGWIGVREQKQCASCTMDLVRKLSDVSLVNHLGRGWLDGQHWRSFDQRLRCLGQNSGWI